MQQYHNLYFDRKNDRFAIFIDEKSDLNFVYWHALKKHGYSRLPENCSVDAQVCETQTHKNMRGLHFSSLSVLTDVPLPDKRFEVHRNKALSQDDVIQLTSTSKAIAVFIGCDFSQIDIQKHTFNHSLVFIECKFGNNFRLLQCKIHGDLWMPNCTFDKHFSVKESIIKGDLHLEAADFRGVGGASFRGLYAQNLFLDLGVEGGEDLFWLNEMIIKQTLSIGGNFKNELQILGKQDADEDSGLTSQIHNIRIGVELYQFENANRTNIDSALRLNGFENGGSIVINNLKAQKVHCVSLVGEILEMNNINVDMDLIIRDCQFSSSTDNKNKGIKTIDCSIGRHLKIQDNRFSGTLDLNGSAVSENSYIENNHYTQGSKLDLRRFTSSRVIISPENFLTKDASFSLMGPKAFSVLHHTDREELGDQYCSLKNWLADAGRLELEDMAYFHMRQCYQSNRVLRLVFGGIFGWGVRLSNIAVSCLCLITLFAAIFTLVDEKIVILKALSLSTQSFISSFFGKWEDYQPDGLLTNLVTFESVLGVLFITVFVGAYIRKLLR